MKRVREDGPQFDVAVQELWEAPTTLAAIRALCRSHLQAVSPVEARGNARWCLPSRELLQQPSGFLQVYGVQPLAEPGIDLWQELACGIAFPLLLPETTQVYGGSQFQRLRLLLASHLKRLTETRF